MSKIAILNSGKFSHYVTKLGPGHSEYVIVDDDCGILNEETLSVKNLAFPITNPPTYTYDPIDLDVAKDIVWKSVKKQRDLLEVSGFPFNGVIFDSDQISAQKISSAAQAASLSPSLSIDWTAADNTIVHLTNQDIKDLFISLVTYVSSLHTIAQEIRTSIQSATSVSQLVELDKRFK